MKRITNILSYLWLLLLMAVTACSDLEEIVVNMQGEEEVELTIQTNIPSLGGSTRTAPTENITSITALAFDSDYELVKVVKATLVRDDTNGENNSTVGTMTIKVPVRTRRIHFIAKNNDEFTEITDADYGRTDINLLKTLSSDELHYWQVVNFANITNLQSFNNGAELKLIRNKARVFLTLPQDASMTGHIVGFLNYNTTGTIAASKNEEFGYVATGDNHEMPSTFLVTSDSDPNANLGNEHYLFEEKNTKGADGFGEAADLVYVVCWIKKGNEDGKYYKIAFKSGESYYHIIRNLEYEIKISKDLDTTRGYANFADAVAKAPINDADAKVQIHMNFNPDPLSLLFGGDPGTTTITGFEGITVLQIGYPKAYFAQGGVAITGIVPTERTEVTTGGGNNIWVDTYSITDQTSLELTATLLSTIQDAHKDIQIQFLGEGSEVFVDDILHANALQRGDLTITTSATKIPKVAGSQFTASVPVQSYAQDVGEYRLFIDDADDAFTITLPDGVRTLADGSYEVTNLAGSQAVFTFTLIEDGEAGDEHEISFDLYTDFHHFIGTTTVMLVEEEIVKEIVATPSANSLNYAGSSVEDLWVKVTIPKEVTTLTFASEHFAVMVAGSQGEYVDSGDGYAINHAENATETIVPFRIRLKDGVSGTAQFTFGGESDKQNVTVQSATGNITLNNNGDANVRWQGNVPLNGNDYDAIVPLKYEWFESIVAGSKLNLEFNVTGGDTSWLEVFEIQGETEDDWTNHNFEELNDDNRYVATGNGNYTLSLTITDEILEAISENSRSQFLGETEIAMAIRGVGITLTKVSVVPPIPTQTVNITATPYASSLNYSANSVSDLIVNVTIPAEVTTLNFSSEYFDVISANGRTKKETVDGEEVSTPYITGSGPYTVNHQNVGELTLPFRLRLKSEKKAPTSSAGYTFGGSGEGVTVTPATISNITLTENGDEYVRWQGDVLLNWGNEGAVTQIPLPYSWFEGLSPGSTLQVEYVITDLNNPEIQFAEVDGEWNKPSEDSYIFPELEVTMDDGGKMGLNLNKNTQPKNIGSQTGIVYTYDLTITQAVLDNIIKMNNRNITLLGESNVVMAIQGGSVRLKKISVMPAAENPNNPLSITLDFYQTEGENLGDGATYDLKAGSTPFYLKATISSDDAVKYSGQKVLLNGTFSSSKVYGKDKNGIHWDYSEIDTPKDGYGKIACNSDGTQLQFTIDPDETDYLIEWVFVPGGQYSGDDINFTYQISGATVDDKPCTLNNESQTTLNVDVLDISLDFDYPATFDGSPAPLDNMVFGVSNFYLRATISQADATAFAGSQVLLAGAFSATSGGGNDAVSWYVSRVEGTIGYDDNFNGTGLLFTIDANQQNYFIHWCFERYNYGEDPASFTYTISKPENANYRFFRVSGETETSLTLKNSAEIFSGTYLFNTGNVWDKFYSISETFPVGTKITVGFGAGQRNDGGSTVKFCDAASQNALKVPSFTGVEYGPDNNLYFSFTGSKTFEVWVNETTELYVNGDGSGNGNSGTPNGNLSNKPLEGFKIEGTDAILQSITVTAPESALRNAQDNNNE
ncbi:MAG: hypothetical protein E7098_05600 [Mediterranea massiliensis]|nr:hypothetical protein [Mediterranea massiliensis]